MATLKNLTISDTGSVQLPSGTTAQRGGAGESVVTFSSVGVPVGPVLQELPVLEC